MRNVYLLDLGTGTNRNLLPLACGLLAAYGKSQKPLKDKYRFHIMMLEENFEDLITEIENPFVIGFSTYCWNILGSLRMAKLCKEKFPGVKIVLGGPSVPAKPDRIRYFFKNYPWLDILVHGEGEITFADLLGSFDRGSLADVRGISYRIEGENYKTNAPRERIKDFTAVPSPFLDGTFDEPLKRYRSSLVGALWETNRGCPFGCTFCDWGNAAVSKVTKLEMDRLFKELDWISEHNLDYVFTTDANFGIFYDRDVELAKHLVDVRQKKGYPSQFFVNWTKNSHTSIVDLAGIFKDGGIHTNVTLSLQSFYQPTLEAIKRRNLRFDVFTDLKKHFYERQLPTYTEFILGLPEETYDSFVDGINQAITTYLEDQFAVYLCCILENTEMATPEYRQKYALETRTCAVGLNRRIFRFEEFGEEIIVVGTSTMPVEDWKRCYEMGFLSAAFYNCRLAFFVMAYLHVEFGMRHTDFIEHILMSVQKNPDRYSSHAKAFAHLRANRQRILDNISSVHVVEGAGGVSLTPHEAVIFLLLGNKEEFYGELRQLTDEFCRLKNYAVAAHVMDEIFRYQEIRIPMWCVEKKTHTFQTSVPAYFDALCRGLKPPPITAVETVAELEIPTHSHKNEVEFNLRRVATSYTFRLFGVQYQSSVKMSGVGK